MGSQALIMETVPAVSMAGLSGSSALGSCSSFSSTSSVHLLVRPSSGFCFQRSRAVPSRGGITAVLPVQTTEDPRRSTFGRGSVVSRTSRPDVRGQASKQTFASFDDMLKNCEVPVLVDFYAVWCGPCQMMVPILNDVNKALQEKVRVVKVDTEKYPDLASRFNIRALPTMVLFKNGKVADRMEGALRGEEIIDRIMKVL